MVRLLRVRDKVLFGLAILGDLFEDISGAGGIVASSYKNVYGFVPEKYKKSNYYATFYRMLKVDLIEKVVEDGTSKFRLTSKGRKKLVRDFPLFILQNRSWDRRWRIVIFDIPQVEKHKRDAFRDKLKELGFGMIQKSVWVSPHPYEEDVREFIDAKKLSKYVYLFVSDSTFISDVVYFVENVWGIEELEWAYSDLINNCINSERGEKEREKFMKGYLKIVAKDPFLPRELLPPDWPADEARKLAKQISQDER